MEVLAVAWIHNLAGTHSACAWVVVVEEGAMAINAWGASGGGVVSAGISGEGDLLGQRLMLVAHLKM